MRIVIAITFLTVFSFASLFAEESRVKIQQSTAEDNMHKSTSSCNEHSFVERLRVQNALLLATDEDKCLDRCERSRQRCYANGGSSIACEPEYSRCAQSCL